MVMVLLLLLLVVMVLVVQADKGEQVGMRRDVNERLMLAERAFLDSAGVDAGDWSWYKHLVSQQGHCTGAVFFQH